MKPILFDTHAHMLDSAFEDDRDALIGSFPDSGLVHVVECCCRVSDIEPIRDLCRTYPVLLATAGSHPEYASEDEIDKLEQVLLRAKEPDCVAVGEIGLDYHYSDGPDRDVQIRMFTEQVEIAKQAGKPVLIHDRDAHGDMMRLLTERKSGLKGIMHCYSGSYEDAVRYIDMGLYIAFGGALTFHNAVRQAEIVKKLPLDRLLIETDCPYMTPVPFRGKRNDPRYVRYPAEKIAELKGISYEEAAWITCRNARVLFGLNTEEENG